MMLLNWISIRNPKMMVIVVKCVNRCEVGKLKLLKTMCMRTTWKIQTPTTIDRHCVRRRPAFRGVALEHDARQTQRAWRPRRVVGSRLNCANVSLASWQHWHRHWRATQRSTRDDGRAPIQFRRHLTRCRRAHQQCHGCRCRCVAIRYRRFVLRRRRHVVQWPW